MSKSRKLVLGFLTIFILTLSILLIIRISTEEKSSVDFSSAQNTSTINENGSVGLIYVSLGGRNHWLNPSSIQSVEELHSIRSAYRYGYDFKGWYLDPEGEYPIDEVDQIASSVSNLILYAKWDDEIDNYANVEEYNYISNQEAKASTIRLKDLNYSFLNKLRIPGMPSTKNDEILNQFIYSQAQCPQGILVTDEYYFITAYSSEEECMGEVLVFDKDSGRLLVTLGMSSDSHLGGIAFDGENIWVCNSNNWTVERLSYDFVIHMAEVNSGEVVDCREAVDSFSVGNSPSCITYYNGRLWIATHTKLFNSKVVSYYYDKKNDNLKSLGSYHIPAQVQGLSFDDEGRVYLSTSYGRKNSSFLKIYKSTFAMSQKPDKPEVQIEMPPCSEEIDIVDHQIYVLFESAGEKYYAGTDGNGTSICPIDKVLRIDMNSIDLDQIKK